MKRKVKKYAGGTLVDSSGNPVRSGSGDVIRTRSDDEIAEDMKRPMGQSMPRAARPTVSEDRPTAGADDYATLGKARGAMSMMSGAPSIKEETPQDIYEPDSVAGEGAKNLAAPIKEKRKNKIVSKKQLEESGLSLRDYLNKERGLTRKGMASGGKTSSASSRGDGIAQRGKTRGRIC